jgi:hypothetical protein
LELPPRFVRISRRQFVVEEDFFCAWFFTPGTFPPCPKTGANAPELGMSTGLLRNSKTGARNSEAPISQTESTPPHVSTKSSIANAAFLEVHSSSVKTMGVFGHERFGYFGRASSTKAQNFVSRLSFGVFLFDNIARNRTSGGTVSKYRSPTPFTHARIVCRDAPACSPAAVNVAPLRTSWMALKMTSTEFFFLATYRMEEDVHALCMCCSEPT